MLSFERLREIVAYDTETGLFKTTTRKSCRYPAGMTVGKRSRKGHVIITIDGRCYFAHRLSWLYVTGSWPSKQIDHINGVRSDNRWINLRDVSHAANQQNRRGPSKNSTTGLLGIQRNGNRFQARICVHRKRLHLGSFDTPEAAHAAYIEAKRRLHEGCTI